VKEYHLNTPVDHHDISELEKTGEVILKNLGGTELFTYSSESMTIKGMIGDTIVFVTHQKDNTDRVELTMNTIFE